MKLLLIFDLRLVSAKIQLKDVIESEVANLYFEEVYKIWAATFFFVFFDLFSWLLLGAENKTVGIVWGVLVGAAWGFFTLFLMFEPLKNLAKSEKLEKYKRMRSIYDFDCFDKDLVFWIRCSAFIPLVGCILASFFKIKVFILVIYGICAMVPYVLLSIVAMQEGRSLSLFAIESEETSQEKIDAHMKQKVTQKEAKKDMFYIKKVLLTWISWIPMSVTLIMLLFGKRAQGEFVITVWWAPVVLSCIVLAGLNLFFFKPLRQFESQSPRFLNALPDVTSFICINRTLVLCMKIFSLLPLALSVAIARKGRTNTLMSLYLALLTLNLLLSQLALETSTPLSTYIRSLINSSQKNFKKN